MASGQSQGLQVALIVSIVLVVILAVTTFLGFNSYSGVIQERDEAKSELGDALDINRKVEQQIEQVAARVGYPEMGEPSTVGSESDAADAESLLGRIKRDMQQFAGEGDKTYKGALAYLDDHVRGLTTRIEELEQENQQLTDAFEKRTAETDRLVAEAVEARNQAQADRDRFIDTFAAENKELVENEQKAREDLAKAVNERQQMQLNMQDLADAHADEIRNMRARIEDLQARVRELEFVDLERPDGQIRSVDRRIGSVYINLGKADFLPEQISFSVYPRDARTVGAEKPKAKIEVIRILPDEDHLAEARITEEELYDPIGPGDLIYNPGWNPGRQILFALAGRYYVDEDAQSDRDLIKSLIREFNGAVYDEANPIEGTCEVVAGTGQILGEINHLTSYLVLGDPPQLGEGDVAAGDASAIESEIRAYNDVLEQARQFGVRVIPFRQFLDIVGYTSQRRLHQAGTERSFPREHGVERKGEPITSERYSRGRVSMLYTPGFKSSMLPASRTRVNSMYMPGFKKFELRSSRTPVNALYMQGQRIRSSRGRVHQAYEGSTMIENDQAVSADQGAPSGNGAATDQP
jgi:hypothetical protein